MTVATRWVAAEEGWRTAVLDLVALRHGRTPPEPLLSSVLIANRGEIARRVIRACRALGVRSVAVYSEADADWPYAREADLAIAIGPAPARESYLNRDRILEAARRARVEAIHPGYGFLSENWQFARACEDAGFVFVGPPWPVVRQMGDKVAARRLMAAAGVPVVPGSEGTVDTLGAARETAARLGYPVILKAAAGGGGIGMVKVADEEALGAGFAAAERRAQAAFGSGALFVERFLEAPRHVEVQVLGDAYGGLVHLYERECSIQRRHQKLVEESPAPGLPAGLRERLTAAAVAGARAVGYVNAGTMEFIVTGRGVLLPRDEHAASGRAPGDGGSDGPGPRPVAAEHRRRRARLPFDQRRDPPARLQHRVPDLRRGSGESASCRLPAG